MACKKVCEEAPAEKKMKCELGRTPQSIKRVTYKYEKEIGAEGFIYKYWWSFPRDQYEVKVTLKSGIYLFFCFGEFFVVLKTIFGFQFVEVQGILTQSSNLLTCLAFKL